MGREQEKITSAAITPYLMLCVHTLTEEGLSFPVASSGAAEAEAELPPALWVPDQVRVWEIHSSSNPGRWRLLGAWPWRYPQPKSCFYFKTPSRSFFPALRGMLKHRHCRASPAPHGISPRHVGLAEPAVATSACHSHPVPPELINKTSGVILAPGTGLSPGAQSSSFSVSLWRPSSLSLPRGEQDVD